MVKQADAASAATAGAFREPRGNVARGRQGRRLPALMATLLAGGLCACSSSEGRAETQAEAVHRNLRVGMAWNEVVSLASGVTKGGLGCIVPGTTPAGPCQRGTIRVESSTEVGLTRLEIEVEFGPDGRVIRFGPVRPSES